MNIVNKRMWYFVIVAVISLICIVSLAVQGLNRGIDFQAGTQLTLSFDQAVTKDQVRAELDTLGFKDASLSLSSAGHYYVQTRELNPAETQKLQADLTAKLGVLKVNYESVPQNIANESLRNALIAVLVAILGMLIYIAFAFRKMPSPFKFGVCAVAGLAFDILLTVGVYSIFGKIMNWSIDLMFVAGILAVLGYSINNTIIVFDRIRENTARGFSHDIEIVANASIVETLGRSFNSSLTVLFTLFVLLLFVGSSIQNFVIVLIIGTISGALTSTFLSPELLVSWLKKKGPASNVAVKSKA
jgi:preprotein translocase subunit SecF